MAYTCKIFSRKNNTLDQAAEIYGKIDKACLYNIPEYLNILSDYLYEDIELNIFVLRSDNGIIFYPFFKRALKDIPMMPEAYHACYDIIGSWYYGGPMVSGQTEKLIVDYADGFSRYCENEGIIAEFVRFDPNIGNHRYFDRYYDICRNRETVYVDLSQDYPSIWNGYRGRCRTAVRKAIKNNIKISDKITPDRIQGFANIYQAEMERKADSRHYFFSSQFFHRLVQTMPDQFKYFFAFHGDTLCGGTIVYHRNDIAYDFLMATHIDFWKYQPNNILLDCAIKWAKSNGCTVFDLMGGRPGVFRFKSSFSNLRQYFYTGTKIYNHAVYSELEQITLDLVGDACNSDFFPAYRQLETLGET